MRYPRQDNFWPLGGVGGGVSDLATLPWQRTGFKSTTTSAAREDEVARGDGGASTETPKNNLGLFCSHLAQGQLSQRVKDPTYPGAFLEPPQHM